MNKRIKELLYEAGGQYGGEHITTGQDVIYTEEVDYEKFAELIVRECSAVANHFSDGHELDQFGRKMYHYTVDIGQVINEHFGVEE